MRVAVGMALVWREEVSRAVDFLEAILAVALEVEVATVVADGAAAQGWEV